MLQSLVSVPIFLLVAACASTPLVLNAMADSQLKASEELECMSECLEDAEETCESCAAQCLSQPPEVAAND